MATFFSELCHCDMFSFFFRKAAPETTSDEVSAVEEFVGTVRKEFCSLATEVNSLTNKASGIVKENLEASNGLFLWIKIEMFLYSY